MTENSYTNCIAENPTTITTAEYVWRVAGEALGWDGPGLPPLFLPEPDNLPDLAAEVRDLLQLLQAGTAEIEAVQHQFAARQQAEREARSAKARAVSTAAARLRQDIRSCAGRLTDRPGYTDVKAILSRAGDWLADTSAPAPFAGFPPTAPPPPAEQWRRDTAWALIRELTAAEAADRAERDRVRRYNEIAGALHRVVPHPTGLPVGGLPGEEG